VTNVGMWWDAEGVTVAVRRDTPLAQVPTRPGRVGGSVGVNNTGRYEQQASPGD
jgi:hypothetical protein